MGRLCQWGPHRVALLCVFALCMGGCPEEIKPQVEDTDSGSEPAPQDVVAPEEVDDASDGSETTQDTEDDTIEDPEVDADVVPDEVASDISEPDPDVDDGGGPEPTGPESFSLQCTDNEECAVACSTGICVDGLCQFEQVNSGCVIVDTEANTGLCLDPGDSHPEHPCLFCNPSVATMSWTPVFVATGFETGGAGGIQAQNLSGSSATWSVIEGRAASGTHSLYFGDPDLMSYGVDDHAWARATMGPYAIPASTSINVSFSLWLDTEETKGYDFLRVVVLHGNDAVTEVWHSDILEGTTHGAFLPVTLTIDGFSEKEVRIAFEFDSVDDIINNYEGAYVDDVRVATGCCGTALDCEDSDPCTTHACPALGSSCENTALQGCCTVSADCDDGDQCTEDLCGEVGGSCEHVPIAECCGVAADCDDGNPCTEDSCPENGGLCLHVVLCCAQDKECGDDDDCTVDTCQGGVCVYDDTCCKSDSMCNDGDFCTNDFCVDGDCQYEPANFPGCCETNADCDDGDLCTENSCIADTGSCTAVNIEGCCHYASDCDDGLAGTSDDCVGNWCFNCGDGTCSSGETCTSCESDCGPCEQDGSCVNKCDQQSGFCWCDWTCPDFGDCCPDACELCGYCGFF